MPAVIRTPLKPVLLAIQAQLASRTGLPAERVALLGRRQEPPHFADDHDLWVRPGVPAPDPAQNDGAGRIATVINRQLLVVLRSRLWADLSDRDDFLLTDDAYGHLALEEVVLDALHDFMPTSGQDALLWEPMRAISYPAEDDEAPAPGQWEETRFAFEVKYMAALNQAVLI